MAQLMHRLAVDPVSAAAPDPSMAPRGGDAAAPAEQRRSPRIMLRVPLRVEVGTSACSAHTVIVSRHGALILCRLAGAEGTRVDVWNLETGEQARFRIAFHGGEELPGLHKLGIELADDRPGFWGSEYEAMAEAS
jgi:hypothetical protein